MSVMFGEKPPTVYTSTGVCESSRSAACVSGPPKQLVRDIECANRVLFSDGKFTWLAGDQLLQLIARGANACLAQNKKMREEMKDALGQQLSDPEAISRDNSIDYHEFALNVLASVAELMKDPSSEPLAEVDILHIIDSGGQLQFHEMQQKVLAALHATIFVTDITADPCSKIVDLFFVDDKAVGEPYESQYTHEQLFKRSLQALQLQNQSGKLAIVATHLDQIDEDMWKEKIETKDRWVSEILKSTKMGGSKIVYSGDSVNDIVFPLQADNPSQSDKDMAHKLLSKMRSKIPVEEVDIPLRRFLLEQTLRKAGKKSRGIVTMSECHRIARSFKIDSVDSALRFLANRNLILYVPEVIDDLVFCEVQTPLSVLKQLVQYSAKVRADSEVKHTSSANLDPDNLSMLATQGVLTEELIQEEFENQFNADFTPKKFLKLMEHFEIVARKSTHPPIEYFMSCVLREVPEDDLKNYRMPVSDNCEPLLLYFGEWPQAEIFCTLVTRLISKYGWEPNLFQACGAAVECMYRNCISFSANPASGFCYDVTLIESYDSGYFEVHIYLPDGESPECYNTICPEVRQTLHDSLPSEVQPIDAFICSIPSCTRPKQHAAVLHTDDLLKCTKGVKKMRIKSNDKRYKWRGKHPHKYMYRYMLHVHVRNV